MHLLVSALLAGIALILAIPAILFSLEIIAACILPARKNASAFKRRFKAIRCSTYPRPQ